MILEPPEAGSVDRHPDQPEDALVRIHQLVRDTGGAVYRVVRTMPLSTLEQEGPPVAPVEWPG